MDDNTTSVNQPEKNQKKSSSDKNQNNATGANPISTKKEQYTDYQKREREKVKSPFREMKSKRTKVDRTCSVPGCKNKVADGNRFLCLAHYARGGDNEW